MRIGVDVMGGDNAPDEILKGCFASLAKLEATDTLVLLGDEAIIRDTMMERRITDARIEVVHCSEVIGMDESPVEAIRSKGAAYHRYQATTSAFIPWFPKKLP